MNETLYNWYPLFHMPTFEALNLVSRKLVMFLEGVGEKEILVTKGNVVSILYEGQFLPVAFNDQNPYAREGVAVYKDENDNVYLGLEVSE